MDDGATQRDVSEASPSRWQKAVSDTQFLRWKREIGVGFSAGVLAVLALAIFGSAEDVRAELIVLGSAILAMFLLPLTEFGWNWLQAPTRLLREDVAKLHDVVRERFALANETAAREREAEFRPALHALIDELTTIRFRLNTAQEAKHFGWDFDLPSAEWKSRRDVLANYVPVETRRLTGIAYFNANELNRLVQSREGNGSEMPSKDQLLPIIENVDKAIEALQRELATLDKISQQRPAGESA